jgi:hypothetical protein
MPAVYAAIARDELRDNLIFDDVLKALEAKRSPIVLTERRDHLEYLQGRFLRFVRNLVVLRGGMSAAERKASDAGLRVAAIRNGWSSRQDVTSARALMTKIGRAVLDDAHFMEGHVGAICRSASPAACS